MKYTKQLINIKDNPFILFDKWFVEAKQKEINNPNAMNLATVGSILRPSSRMVLLKSYDTSGFVFYTNLNSRKGINIKKNSKVFLNFYWKSLLKQIGIRGVAEFVSDSEADDLTAKPTFPWGDLGGRSAEKHLVNNQPCGHLRGGRLAAKWRHSPLALA